MTTPSTAAAVHASEFLRARERLGLTPATLAAELGLTPGIVAGFEEGTLAVPKATAAELRWRVAARERSDALEASGLPACAWVARWEREEAPSRSAAMLKHLEALNQHAAACPTCVARTEFVAQRFGPMPERPVPGWLGLLGAIMGRVERLPAWLQPAVNGALFFLAMSAVRVAFALPRLKDAPGGWLIAVEGLAASAVLGAVLGSAVAAVRGAQRAIRSRRSVAR